jgi:hypothetical protein
VEGPAKRPVAKRAETFLRTHLPRKQIAFSQGISESSYQYRCAIIEPRAAPRNCFTRFNKGSVGVVRLFQLLKNSSKGRRKIARECATQIFFQKTY